MHKLPNKDKILIINCIDIGIICKLENNQKHPKCNYKSESDI